MERAVFGAGCFWEVEESYRKVKGVISTKVGYMGGATVNPSYEQVSSQTTGHAEVVQIDFDETKIQYKDLLEIFWKIHDPTSSTHKRDKMGQYRSVIFYHNLVQKEIAESSLEKESKKYKKKICTTIIPAMPFFIAEKIHQKYLQKKGQNF